MSEQWEVISKKSSGYTLEIKDPEGWRSARVRWDGCVHYYRYFNTPLGMDAKNDNEENNYIHICDIDEEIARLQSLKRLATNWFAQYGQSEYWQADIVESAIDGEL